VTRQAAAVQCGDRNDQRDIPALDRALKNETDKNPRLAIIEALKRLGRQFPSLAVGGWVNTFSRIAENQHEFHRFDGALREGVIRLPPARQAQFISKLVWTTWIDQGVYSKTGIIGGRTLRRSLYARDFRQTYPFPKFIDGGFSGRQVHLAWDLLSRNGGGRLGMPDITLPDLRLLKKDKIALWDREVAVWLCFKGRRDIMEAVDKGFLEDLRQFNGPERLRGLV